MEQDERGAVDPSEGDTEQGCEAPAAALAGDLAGADEGKQERVSAAENYVNAKAASEGAKKQVLEMDAFESPVVAHFEFRAEGVGTAGTSSSSAAPPAGHPSALPASPGSALPSGLRTGISGVIDAAEASSSNRPPSRGRKQPRPEHFIPEEAEATASAKARRSDIALNSFLSSLVQGSSASEWVSNVTAEDSRVRGNRQNAVEGFRIRDVSRHAARASGLRAALSPLGCASPPSSGAPESSPGEPDGRGRIYGVLAVLGASLALTVATFVLFYIVGQSGERGPSGEKPDE